MRKFVGFLGMLFSTPLIAQAASPGLGGAAPTGVAQTINIGSVASVRRSDAAAQLGNAFKAQSTISGAATLGQPATGYRWNFNAASHYSDITNLSGWNQALGSNSGRTGVANNVAFMSQNGNGDAGTYYGHCAIGGPGRAGATHWLAEPACIILNGDLTTTLAHSFLNQFEFNLSDNGVDAAAIGTVEKFHRTVNAAAFGEVWMGDRWQSVGTKAIDVGWSGSGLVNVGLDMVTARADPTFDNGNSVALNMTAGQRIIYNSRAAALNGIKYYGNQLGNAYDAFSSNRLSRCNGTACLNLGIASAASTVPVQLASYRVSTLPVCDIALQGGMAYVTDAAAPAYNAAVKGGGTVVVPVFCNGSAWTSH